MKNSLHQTIESRNRLSGVLLLLFLVVLTPSSFSRADSGATTIDLIVEGCNSNLICEINLGENINNCASDCTATGMSTSASTGGGGGPVGLSSGGAGATLAVTNLEVTTGTTNAVIRWQSSTPSISSLEWGTSDVNSSLISEVFYTTEHTFKLENLTPGTRYIFSIKAQDSLRRTTGVSNQQFVTKLPVAPLPVPLPPSNISELTMTTSDTAVFLKWQVDSEAVSVRVTRSKSSYPQDPFEGKVVYEGSGTSAVDRDIANGETYYYTVFTLGKNGLYSSGAIIQSDPEQRSRGSTSVASKLYTNNLFSDARAGLEKLAGINITDFVIMQKNIPLSFSTQLIVLNGDESFNIAIPAEKIPDSIRDIVLTLRNVESPNVYISYLLTLNKNNQNYEATVPRLPIPGDYDLRVAILDYSSQVFGTVQAKVLVEKAPQRGIPFTEFKKIVEEIARADLTFIALLSIVWAGLLKLLKTVGNLL